MKKTVWQQLLDLLAAGDGMFGDDDSRRWNPRQREEVFGLGILREMELAESVYCDQCGDPHFSDVHWVTPGVAACFGCPTEGVIDIEIDRLRQWRIDTDRIAGLVAGSLDLTSPVENYLSNHLWHIGRRRLGGRYRDVFMGIGAGTPVSAMSAAIRSRIGPGSAVLLTVGCNGNPEGLPSSHHLIDLASVSRVEGGRVMIDLEYVEERLAASDPAVPKSVPSISVPAGATWADVSVVVFDAMLEITVRGKVHEVDFAGLGVDQQTQPIELLKLFAAARGTLDVAKIQKLATGESPIKMRILRLRQLLKELIAVDGDPFDYKRKAQTYICRFEIRLASDDGFHVPAGATWLNLVFHERADGRILVSVPEKQQFRAFSSSAGGSRGAGEVAEAIGAITRTYSLEEMGLRSDRGRLTDEGAAFIALLRAGGSLPRRGDDMIVLSLAKRLCEWTSLDGEPLRLVEAANSWTASFACSSEVGHLKR